MNHTVESLINLSEKRNFEMADMPWHMVVDHNKKWIPSSIDPIQYLPSYDRLSDEEKLKINQYYATGMCEKFVFFEYSLTIALEALLVKRKNIPKDLEKLMHIFIKEEQKHSEMFNTLANKALPEKYKGEDYYFLTNNRKIWLANNVIFKNPDIFVYWIWLGAYFEEKTIVFSKEYMRHKKEVDPLFHQIHKFHLMDEARHVEIDKHFFEYFYDNQSKFKKSIAKKMFASTVESIQVPKRTLKKIFSEVIVDLKVKNTSVYDSLLEEINFLPQSREYMDVMFGKKSFPIFHQLLDTYKEFEDIGSHFV